MQLARSFLAEILDVVAAQSLALKLRGANVRLFTNDFEPNEDSAIGDFTEADFAGYGSIELTLDDWSRVVDTATGFQSLVGVPPEGGIGWKLTALPAQTCYGVYVTNSDDSELIAYKRFDSPLEMAEVDEWYTLPIPVLFGLDAASSE